MNERLIELKEQLEGARKYLFAKRRRVSHLAYIARLEAEIKTLGG